jgi:nucleotide-binding universal stress UspA family protein
MYTKIVVPLDCSPLAEVALPYAEEIAGKMGSDMVLLTVLPSEEPREVANYLAYSKKMASATRIQVKKYLEDQPEVKITISTATRTGSPAEGILNYADKGYPSLIVMATHGRSGLSRWAMGSVADKVVKDTSKQPLLLVRAKGSHPDMRAKRILKKALVPLDGSATSESVLPYIEEIARNLDMEITLLRVIHKAEHNFSEVENYLRTWCETLAEQGVNAGYEVRTGNAAEQIINYADETATDLIAMTTRGQTPINVFSLGSVAQKILMDGNSPLFMVKV